MRTKIFVNLPVKNLEKTNKFFSKLGFKFNKKYTDNNASCMIVSDDIFVMLLKNNFFKTFIKSDIVNAKKSTEVLIGISSPNRKSVDEMLDKAIKAGGKEYRKPEDHGWMYGRSFQDIDGHIWEIIYMDEKAR